MKPTWSRLEFINPAKALSPYLGIPMWRRDHSYQTIPHLASFWPLRQELVATFLYYSSASVIKYPSWHIHRVKAPRCIVPLAAPFLFTPTGTGTVD